MDRISAALREIAQGFATLERGFRHLADALPSDALSAVDSLVEHGHSSGDWTLDQREVERLFGRLGKGNKQFLHELALAFSPATPFTLEDASERLGASTGTLRARLMNVGRSLKSMGNDFTLLWDTEWTLSGENRYTWRDDSHAHLLRLTAGG